MSNPGTEACFLCLTKNRENDVQSRFLELIVQTFTSRERDSSVKKGKEQN